MRTVFWKLGGLCYFMKFEVLYRLYGHSILKLPFNMVCICTCHPTCMILAIPHEYVLLNPCCNRLSFPCLPV